jgi:hypothetical protein
MKMKTTEKSPDRFNHLSPDELTSIGGEGFAYDAGRFLRYMALAAGGMAGQIQIYADFAVYSTY